MKKTLALIVFSLLLFYLSYQVRIGFLGTKDYIDGADAAEYKHAASGAIDAIRHTTDITSLINTGPWFVEALDAHSAPATNMYFTIISLNSYLQKEIIAAILNSLLVVLLFLVGKKLFSYLGAIVISLIAVIFTSLYAFVHSHMPEAFGSFFIPLLSLGATFFALRSDNSRLYSILTGACLGFMALYRIEFRWVGLPFVFIWFFAFSKSKNRIKHVVIMFSSYLVLVIGWMLLAKFLNPHPYYHSSNVIHVLHNTYNWVTYGWLFDTAPIRTIPELINHIVYQGPFRLLWLHFALVVRLWTRPPTAWIGEYLIPDFILFPLHFVLIALALFGLRQAFFKKHFLFLAVPLIWGTFLSFNPEEMRRQVPLVAIMLLFAGGGLIELFTFLKMKNGKRILTYLAITTFLILISPDLLYGAAGFFYPKFTTLLPLRTLFLLTEIILLILAVKLLFKIDKKKSFIFTSLGMKKLPSLIPLIVFIVITAYQLRSHNWHEWSTPLLPKQMIRQAITIDANIVKKLNIQKGYLLIDVKDLRMGKQLRVSLNGKELSTRLPLSKSFSHIDLLVMRQFQRGLPRKGFGIIEELLLSESIFPNIHEWLIIPLEGNKLKEKNTIDVINIYQGSDNPPIIFGDYYSTLSFPTTTYDGPTPRIYQGSASFYKFQVDSDIRLSERRHIFSKNESTYYKKSEKQEDLSSNFGVQTGRYRIFFLFPFTTGDPEDIF